MFVSESHLRRSLLLIRGDSYDYRHLFRVSMAYRVSVISVSDMYFFDARVTIGALVSSCMGAFLAHSSQIVEVHLSFLTFPIRPS